MQPRIALDLDQSLGSSGCVPWLLLVLTHHALPGRKVRQLPVESNAADVATHTRYAKYYIQILACIMLSHAHIWSWQLEKAVAGSLYSHRLT